MLRAFHRPSVSLCVGSKYLSHHRTLANTVKKCVDSDCIIKVANGVVLFSAVVFLSSGSSTTVQIC